MENSKKQIKGGGVQSKPMVSLPKGEAPTEPTELVVADDFFEFTSYEERKKALARDEETMKAEKAAYKVLEDKLETAVGKLTASAVKALVDYHDADEENAPLVMTVAEPTFREASDRLKKLLDGEIPYLKAFEELWGNPPASELYKGYKDKGKSIAKKAYAEALATELPERFEVIIAALEGGLEFPSVGKKAPPKIPSLKELEMAEDPIEIYADGLRKQQTSPVMIEVGGRGYKIRTGEADLDRQVVATIGQKVRKAHQAYVEGNKRAASELFDRELGEGWEENGLDIESALALLEGKEGTFPLFLNAERTIAAIVGSDGRRVNLQHVVAPQKMMDLLPNEGDYLYLSALRNNTFQRFQPEALPEDTWERLKPLHRWLFTAVSNPRIVFCMMQKRAVRENNGVEINIDDLLMGNKEGYGVVSLGEYKQANFRYQLRMDGEVVMKSAPKDEVFFLARFEKMEVKGKEGKQNAMAVVAYPVHLRGIFAPLMAGPKPMVMSNTLIELAMLKEHREFPNDLFPLGRIVSIASSIAVTKVVEAKKKAAAENNGEIPTEVEDLILEVSGDDTEVSPEELAKIEG